MQTLSGQMVEYEGSTEELLEGRSRIADAQRSEENRGQVLIQLGRSLMDLRRRSRGGGGVFS